MPAGVCVFLSDPKNSQISTIHLWCTGVVQKFITYILLIYKITQWPRGQAADTATTSAKMAGDEAGGTAAPGFRGNYEGSPLVYRWIGVDYCRRAHANHISFVPGAIT